MEEEMALIAFAAPVIPGKKDQWEAFVHELQGPRFEEFKESRQSVGLRERTFHMATPDGDMGIVTLEGDDPAASLITMSSADTPFMNWFVEQVQEIHGFDLRNMPGPLPVQLVDTGAV
jgi:hypothetical protein